jgi:hypothetical protein
MLSNNKGVVLPTIHTSLVFRQVICTISIFVFYFEFPTSLLIGFDISF